MNNNAWYTKTYNAKKRKKKKKIKKKKKEKWPLVYKHNIIIKGENKHA